MDLFIVYFACKLHLGLRGLTPTYTDVHLLCIAYSYFGAEYGDWPTMGTCTGTEGAAVFGCALLTSYLFLVSPPSTHELPPAALTDKISSLLFGVS